ncbi:hypothetical protein [Streptomyces sp. CL12]|uniref:hypothetical protein n=1 Tax=Streptomyces sp. CL12 TaxID=3391744 RepID=UPI003A808747
MTDLPPLAQGAALRAIEDAVPPSLEGQTLFGIPQGEVVALNHVRSTGMVPTPGGIDDPEPAA